MLRSRYMCSVWLYVGGNCSRKLVKKAIDREVESEVLVDDLQFDDRCLTNRDKRREASMTEMLWYLYRNVTEYDEMFTRI